ncbi:MAG: HAD family phosphatase [Acidobacteria bacterium]|nr:HAD family phosphatase [Acidobacteriota bacterium]
MPSPRKPPVRAIFFDFDGVLMDTEPLHHRCWAEVLQPYGIRLTWTHYAREMIGVSAQEMIESLCRKAGRPYTDKFFTACYRKKKELFVRRAARVCQPPDKLKTFLRNNHDWPYLAAMVCEDDVQNRKPAPDPYLLALKRVNNAASRAIKPAECLVVEDSDPGAEAGLKAGMRVVRVLGPRRVLKALEAALLGIK